jgi:hypothetical protein
VTVKVQREKEETLIVRVNCYEIVQKVSAFELSTELDVSTDTVWSALLRKLELPNASDRLWLGRKLSN